MQGERDQPDQTGRKQNPQPGGGQLPPQHHEPQKCPRCDSHNTKFCYYNNYSLSQPRYFCKACRRYWTHGGTLRNVPVGGGCRKGKRAKTMSSSSSASATNSARSIVQPQQDHQLQQHRSLMMSAGQTALGSLVGGSQYYSGSTGYMASLPFAQSLNNLGRAYHLGLGSSSNLSLMQGFNAMSSYGQRQMPTQFFKSNMEPPPMYIYNDHGAMLLQPTRPTSIMSDWGESFINKSHASASVATISTGQSPTWSTTNTNTTNVGHGGGFSLNTTLWPNDLAGFYVNGPPQ